MRKTKYKYKHINMSTVDSGKVCINCKHYDGCRIAKEIKKYDYCDKGVES